MQIRKLTGFMGAEISGLDLKQPISSDITEGLRAALAAHQMIVLRGQFLTIEDQKRLNRVFGPAMQLPYVTPMEGEPEVIAVLKEASEKTGGVFGGEWHSDFSFLKNPPAGSVLNAVEIPDVGGDTVWSSQVAAYDSLPADLKALIHGRDAIHVGKPYGVKHAPPEETRSGASIKMVRGDPAADREISHPAVITGSDGRKALFVNPIYTTRLSGMNEAESAPILEALYKHATRPDFSCRLKWQAGDVAVWDNRMSLHYATNDYDGARRLLYRTTFSAAPPR
ncbi:TauD/TfdA dioxygenase family protein [Neptunicoccus cionae]|uniref:Alpha-ketoglutarate-dependent taurine dioxygenase n=1 Tax=Neptunicoccus cionae TaxID=2035344 RepID=A0A916QTT2_9RHOB|nr:TauD/TfdA family dioxygenase [Amylibacter cionae]GGA12306.1 alpha-ketoglutarate-dependent taurine dioxygenase [Amylibacter cionae]